MFEFLFAVAFLLALAFAFSAGYIVGLNQVMRRIDGAAAQAKAALASLFKRKGEAA